MNRFRPLPLLLAAAGAAAYVPAFLDVAPNRLVTGAGISLGQCAAFEAAGIAALLAAFAATAFRPLHWLALLAGCGVFLTAPLAAGAGAHTLLAHAPTAARVHLAAGFWLLLVVSLLIVLDAVAALHWPPWRRVALCAAVAAGLTAEAQAGWLGELSLAQEFVSHRSAFWDAGLRHLVLVGITLMGAIAAGAPLGAAAWRHGAWRPAIFGILNVIQTLPSIALFGLLMAPLAHLGLSGIGLVPACIALIAYALLPTVRAIVTGLDGVPGAPVLAARGLGLSAWQIFLQLRLPLAAPALLAGLRVVVVQAVGLAVVAALIGAGGFGDFVFQGLGQYATDLVLLGALPATALALAADAMLSMAAGAAARRAG